jgi:hypothetical protein
VKGEAFEQHSLTFTPTPLFYGGFNTKGAKMADHVSIINPPRAAAPAPNAATDLVNADGWWPALSIVAFRAEQRVSDEITPVRVRAALRTAMQTALIDLGAWGVTQRIAGYETLSDVPAPQIDGVSHYALCWNRAIFALAKAELAETHRDYDATGAGERNTDYLENSIGQLRRDATHAIRDLKGRGREFAELI